MAWTVSVFTVLAFGSAGVALLVGMGVMRNRPDPLAWPLGLAMLAVAAWAIPHGVSFGFDDPARVALWHQLRYTGTVVAPMAFLVFALRYAGYDEWLSRPVYVLISVIPAIAVLGVATNPYHWLFWRSIGIERVAGTTLFTPEFGPLFWVHLTYLYAVAGLSLFILGHVAIRSGPLYRKQATLIFVGGMVPFSANISLYLGLLPAGTPDLTTTAFTISGITVALALYHFDLLEISPIAHDRLLAELDDGVVVIGPEGRIRDFNPVAADILGDLRVDQPASEVLPSTVVPDGGEVVVERDGLERTYRTRATSLTDHRGRQVGRIVYLNDVTSLVRREQRISVLNRVLRHNIRNELNIAMGNIDLVADELDGDHRTRLDRVRESVADVISFAEKARYVERTVQAGDAAIAVSLDSLADRMVELARERHPDASIHWQRADETPPRVGVIDEELCAMAIDELIENAIRHNDSDRPDVALTLEPDPDPDPDPDVDLVHLRVADNGPGIPQQELDVLTARAETQLVHGSGLGLWLVRWAVTLSGGRLSFDANEPRGSIVTLSLPVMVD